MRRNRNTLKGGIGIALIVVGVILISNSILDIVEEWLGNLENKGGTDGGISSFQL